MVDEQVKIDQHKSTIKIVISEKSEVEKSYVEALQIYGTQFDIMLNMYMQKINSNMVRFYSKNSYYDGLRFTVDYLEDLTYKCDLVRPAVYLENYKQSFLDGNKTLEIRDVIKKSYDPKNFDNDLSFGCFSVAHRFEFKDNENVIKMKEFDKEAKKLEKIKNKYEKHHQEFKTELNRIVENFDYQVILIDEQE